MSSVFGITAIFSWLVLLVNLALVALGVAVLVLSIKVLLLMIQALRIYIRKTATERQTKGSGLRPLKRGTRPEPFSSDYFSAVSMLWNTWS